MMSVEPVDELDAVTAADARAAVSTARWYSQAARELQQADGWHDTLQRIVELADKIAGADLVALIGLPRPGASPALLAATDYTTAERVGGVPACGRRGAGLALHPAALHGAGRRPGHR